ncbi:MAG: hypothetical protein Q4D16_21945 [Eubacteriales bacterium]|nr:hypothetical protein [Eubacteriales bacterium]
MEDLFTDTPMDTPIEGEVAEPAPIDTPVDTPEPVPDPKVPLDGQTVIIDNPSIMPSQEPAEGVETVPDEDTVTPTPVPDYSDLLAEVQNQSEYLETISADIQICNQQVSNIQNAMPVMVVCLGIITGILLLQILSSYIRH